MGELFDAVLPGDNSYLVLHVLTELADVLEEEHWNACLEFLRAKPYRGMVLEQMGELLLPLFDHRFVDVQHSTTADIMSWLKWPTPGASLRMSDLFKESFVADHKARQPVFLRLFTHLEQDPRVDANAWTNAAGAWSTAIRAASDREQLQLRRDRVPSILERLPQAAVDAAFPLLWQSRPDHSSPDREMDRWNLRLARLLPFLSAPVFKAAIERLAGEGDLAATLRHVSFADVPSARVPEMLDALLSGLQHADSKQCEEILGLAFSQWGIEKPPARVAMLFKDQPLPMIRLGRYEQSDTQLRAGIVDWIAGWGKRQRSEVLGEEVPHLLKLVSDVAAPGFARGLYDSLRLSLGMRP